MKSGAILAIDIGPMTTRAALFDVLGDRYALLGVGSSDTTLEAPFRNLRRGLRFALEELQAITGRILMDGHKTLIRPVNRNGLGVDQCVATVSAGPPIKMVAIGLLESESLANTRSLLETTLAGVVHSIGMRERRNPASVMDGLLRFEPDLFVIAGGTERGAEKAIVKLLEPIVVAYRLIPKDRRPAIIYAGNHALDARIRTLFGETSNLTFAPNLQPDFDHPDLDGARGKVIQSARVVFNKILPGFTDLDRWTLGQVLPTEAAFKRMIQYLSMSSQNNKGVLGIHNSARVIQIAGVFPQGEAHRVSMQPGWMSDLDDLNNRLAVSEVMPWAADADINPGLVMQEFLHQSLYPASLPLSNQSQAIEAAITHALLLEQVKSAFQQLPQAGVFDKPHERALLEPIIACGDIVERSPSPAHTAILLLDCIQPVGVTTMVIDNKQILPMLGAIAGIDPLVTVQMFELSSISTPCNRYHPNRCSATRNTSITCTHGI